MTTEERENVLNETNAFSDFGVKESATRRGTMQTSSHRRRRGGVGGGGGGGGGGKGKERGE